MAEVWPVIHIIDRDRALRNAAIAQHAGCPGVFLISHFGDDDQVDAIAPHIREKMPKLQIGVNYLTLNPLKAIRRSMQNAYHATWADDSGITSESLGLTALHVNEEMRRVRPEISRRHRYFASIAFKGQPSYNDSNPANAACQAIALGFVPTTSGAGTGIAPQVEKLALMRAGLDPHDMLAVASGITPGNVAGFLPYVTHILVASGISSNFHDFDQDKLSRLMATVRLNSLEVEVSSQQRAGGE